MFYFMSLCECLHVCVCTTRLPGTHRGQGKVLDSLELKLHMGVRSEAWVFWKNRSALSFQSVSLIPIL